jgi:hypothetical protein
MRVQPYDHHRACYITHQLKHRCKTKSAGDESDIEELTTLKLHCRLHTTAYRRCSLRLSATPPRPATCLGCVTIAGPPADSPSVSLPRRPPTLDVTIRGAAPPTVLHRASRDRCPPRMRQFTSVSRRTTPLHHCKPNSDASIRASAPSTLPHHCSHQ